LRSGWRIGNPDFVPFVRVRCPAYDSAQCRVYDSNHIPIRYHRCRTCGRMFKSVEVNYKAASVNEERQDINQKYAEIIMTDLIRAGLVRSILGRGGGYLLSRPADQIRLSDIVHAIDVPYTGSGDPRDAAIEKAFKKAQVTMWEALDEVTLAEAVT